MISEGKMTSQSMPRGLLQHTIIACVVMNHHRLAFQRRHLCKASLKNGLHCLRACDPLCCLFLVLVEVMNIQKMQNILWRWFALPKNQNIANLNHMESLSSSCPAHVRRKCHSPGSDTRLKKSRMNNKERVGKQAQGLHKEWNKPRAKPKKWKRVAGWQRRCGSATVQIPKVTLCP